ncbi:T9SS type A sorting domain-containing protein [Flavisolibacter nicotianae]|uniref:T9SS type A sorting domain-containing protein n=1 Tax=Flavisolibacter nicotianae TaxID=2364882 RepID=UPI0013C4E3CE|nr:T9SS type A sorting domain-containing protein [Flavisolibacter nicotianae]
MRNTYLPRTFLSALLLASSLFLHAQSGTSDGTYNFSALGAENSGGTGFRKQGDKFKVSNVFTQDRTTMYANDATPGATETVIIKAEGGTKNKTFTFKDLSLRNFGQNTTLDVFTVTLRNYYGVEIGRLTLASPQSLDVYATAISSFAFSVPFPSGGFADVSEIQIDFHYADAGIAPDEMTFNNISIANVSNAVPLPLTLVEFTARKEGTGVRVHWVTANEQNVDKHVIEHSTDGIRFAPIASFPGQKNLATGSNYSYFHAQPESGKNYYRLKEVDVDGSERSYVVRTVDFAKSAVTVSGSIHGSVVIKGLSAGPYALEIADMSGQVVLKNKIANVSGDYLLPLPATFSHGTYIISLSGNGVSLAQKILLQ